MFSSPLIHPVSSYVNRERECVSNSVSMDFREIVVFMSRPHVACGLAVLLCRLVVLVGVGVVTQPLAMVSMVFISHPCVTRGLTVFLCRLVVLVGICVVAHLIAMVVLVIRVVITVVTVVTVATTAFFGNVFDIITS